MIFLKIYFHNPGIEQVNLSKLLKIAHKTIPINFKYREIPYLQKISSIASKIFNYKQTAKEIPDNFMDAKNECKCCDSQFCDPIHGHVVTGDLRIITNNKLRSLLTKGPKYREQD